MSAELDELALAVDAAIRAVPGVATVFSADPALLRTAREITSAGKGIALTQLARADDVLTITASVGVTDAEQAPATARTISDAIRLSLPPEQRLAATIHVRVSRVTR